MAGSCRRHLPFGLPDEGAKEGVPSFTDTMTEAVAPGIFEILSVDLMFENEQRERLVALNDSVQVTALVHLRGQGRFLAGLEVDGYSVVPIMIPLTTGRVLTLKVQGRRIFPTSKLGSHHVTLKVDAPATRLRSPILTYTVVVALPPPAAPERPSNLPDPSLFRRHVLPLEVTTAPLLMTGREALPLDVRGGVTPLLTMTGLKKSGRPSRLTLVIPHRTETDSLTMTGFRARTTLSKGLDVEKETVVPILTMTGLRK